MKTRLTPQPHQDTLDSSQPDRYTNKKINYGLKFMTTKKKAFITLGLLLSTLIFPWPFALFILIIPPVYVGFIVPYLIWKFVFNGNWQDIPKYSLIWKIPIIFVFNMVLVHGEFFAIDVLTYLPKSTLLLIFAVALYLLILRIIAYAAMILVWQPQIFKPFPKLKWSLIMVIFITTILAGRMTYLMSIAPEGSDYDSYQMYCLDDKNCVIPPEIQQEIDASAKARKEFWDKHSLW